MVDIDNIGINNLSPFQESIIDNITAGTVGISKLRWQSVNAANISHEESVQLMRQKHFDVLPIESNSEVKEFFYTKDWNNYSSINKRELTEQDLISVHSPIRKVIESFVENNRLFYFLSFQKEVVGLISVVNLNSRPVKLYLFSMIIEIEVRLGRIISNKILEENIVALTLDKNQRKYKNIKADYNKDKELGIDLEVFEYLYLSDLKDIALSENLYELIGYDKEEFSKEFEAINNLRNSVAHPRSIIKDSNSLKELDKLIDSMEKAVSRLKKINLKLEIEA